MEEIQLSLLEHLAESISLVSFEKFLHITITVLFLNPQPLEVEGANILVCR